MATFNLFSKLKRVPKKVYVGILAIALVPLLALGVLIYFILPPPEFAREFDKKFDGSVIVVGAGASGLTAAYLLEREGIDVTVIEAQDVYGGRMREAQDFADFPIDLGAEWIHEDPSVLTQIVNDDSKTVDIETITYNPREGYAWDGETLSDDSLSLALYSEYKFKDTTWFSFFENHIVPSVRDRIVLSQPVSNIDYSGDQVVVSTVDNVNFQPAETYTADRVIVTVPITVLQQNYIGFEPTLPQPKVDAINSITVPDGIKVFIDFEEKFYPEILSFSEFSYGDGAHEKIYYDAAFKKDTNRNILGLFTIGDGAKQLVDLESDQARIDFILAELDEIYDGAASRNYKNHIIQNWSSNQFIAGAYSTIYERDTRETQSTIFEPLNNKVFFAGEALVYERQATVPGAAESGFNAVEALLEDRYASN